MYERPKPSKNCAQFLKPANYSPHCIQYLRKEYPEQVSDINAILKQRYSYEYRTAMANLSSREEKIALFTEMLYSRDHATRLDR